MDKTESYKRHLITAALPYANGPLHIGHLAGCYLPADAYARFLRAQGKDVAFICGSDEYGVPISIKALKEHTTPQSIVDTYHSLIKTTFEAMGISYDIYDRTTAPMHRDMAQTLFKQIAERNIFETHEKEQFYDPTAQRFLADRYITGECPYCHAVGAYGDQCEKCGSTLSPEELIRPQSTLSQTPPVKKPSTHWYLPLQDFQDEIAQWILSREKDWKTNVIGQCKSWLDRGLRARAITRDADWGIPVPLPDAKGKVLYVWFDAPIGYISATRALKGDNWRTYWQDENTELIHFIGKDNIVFHCIIFPVMLKASGQPFILPTNVVANEFLNIEGRKISTSRNWAVWVDTYLQDFPDMQDALRYTLFSILPETKDADFTWKDFQARVNNELVAILGNFVYRTFILTHKLCSGRIPVLHQHALDETDAHIHQIIANAPDKVACHIRDFRFRDALQEIMDTARQANKYLQKKAPWIWAQSEKAEAQPIIDNTLYHCLQITANLAILLHPFLPFTARKICAQLKVVPKILEWKNAGKTDLLRERYFIGNPQLLFSKIEDDIIAQQIEKLHRTTAAAAPFPPVKTPIDISAFQQADLRIGRIIAVENIPKSQKLYALKIDIGSEVRNIVSGVAQHFSKEALMNKQVAVLVNIATKKMAGVPSEGMVLFIENQNGQLTLLSPEHTADNGASIS